VGDLLTISIGPRRGMLRGTRAADCYEQARALEAREPDAAMALYRRAIAGRMDLADAHNNLGRLHHDRGELGEAEGCYRVAVCIDPAAALYWFNLGVVVEDQGRHAEALAAYERAIELPGDPAIRADAHFNVARLLELRGRSAGDELLLRRAVRHLVRYRDLSRGQAAR
jgi:tetratricopeptide (TPR) repeat protein